MTVDTEAVKIETSPHLLEVPFLLDLVNEIVRFVYGESSGFSSGQCQVR